MKKYKFLIGGPTSSGKSDLALCLARKYKGVIINADSMQLYKELRILTNRPSVDEMKKIDHKLYGKFCADQICSVERWRKLVINEIKKCEKNWCNVNTDQFSGWVDKNNIWGNAE